MAIHSDEKVGKYLDSRDKRNAATGSNHRHERNQQNCPNGFIQHLLDCPLARLTRFTSGICRQKHRGSSKNDQNETAKPPCFTNGYSLWRVSHRRRGL
jgi:hypothetical protein